MRNNIVKLYIKNEDIQEKIKDIAENISIDYKDKNPVLVCNLKGAFRFLSDLCKYIKIPITIDFIAFTSYTGISRNGDRVRIVKDLKSDIKNRDVIIIEDIIDTGFTCDFIIKYMLEMQNASSANICSLLDKKSARQIDVSVKYIGFDVENKFLVGYGLDYNEKYRELNDIMILK